MYEYIKILLQCGRMVQLKMEAVLDLIDPQFIELGQTQFLIHLILFRLLVSL